MSKDPIAEAKREGWNEAIEAAVEVVRELLDNEEDSADAITFEGFDALGDAILAIRFLHKPTEESET